MATEVASSPRTQTVVSRPPVHGAAAGEAGSIESTVPHTAPPGSAPASATPVPNLRSSADPAGAVPQHELEHLDAEPQKQGFFKGLLSGLKSFVKENAATVLAFGVLATATILTGGAAVVVPLLIGLAAGGATVAACSALLPKTAGDEEEDEDALADADGSAQAPAPGSATADDADKQDAASADGPELALFDPAQRERALEIRRKAEAMLEEVQMVPELPVPSSESVDLLGMDAPRPSDSVDLLGLGDRAPAVLKELADLNWDAPSPSPAPASESSAPNSSMDELGREIQKQIWQAQQKA